MLEKHQLLILLMVANLHVHCTLSTNLINEIFVNIMVPL